MYTIVCITLTAIRIGPPVQIKTGVSLDLQLSDMTRISLLGWNRASLLACTGYKYQMWGILQIEFVTS